MKKIIITALIYFIPLFPIFLHNFPKTLTKTHEYTRIENLYLFSLIVLY